VYLTPGRFRRTGAAMVPSQPLLEVTRRTRVRAARPPRRPLAISTHPIGPISPISQKGCLVHLLLEGMKIPRPSDQ
jgi:hypothetical protein